MDHKLELQETVSLPPCSPCAMPTPQHYLCLVMPRNIVTQLEIDWSEVAAADKEKDIHGSLKNISHPASAIIFVEPLTFEEQFK